MRATTVVLLLATLLTAHPARADEYAPRYDRIRAALQRDAGEARIDVSAAPSPEVRRTPQAATIRKQKDPIWQGALIGLAAGAAGGYLWARNQCGSNDKECTYIAMPIGVSVGAAVGAIAGAIVDALTYD